MLGYGYLITSRIIHGVGDAARVACQIAAGNLAVEPARSNVREVSRLGFFLDVMRKSLVSISRDVEVATPANAGTATGLNANAGKLSDRTEEQAASLEEVAASMEQSTATVKPEHRERAPRPWTRQRQRRRGAARRGGGRPRPDPTLGGER